ncbi:MAG: hypothetical protein D6685_05320 [Bacteroidetes bacterium]|nr:MAG: hypothetical protein D6685_05320 [Bacteroidota bacterium]
MTDATSLTPTQRVAQDGLTVHRLCLEAEGRALSGAWTPEPGQLRALRDAADVALATAHLVLRGSPYHEGLCRLCQEVARACADALGSQEHGDAQIRATYAACVHLTQVCRILLGEAPDETENDHDEALVDTFPASDPVSPPTEL